MDEIINKCKPLTKNYCVGHLQFQKVNITEGIFAYGVVLLAGSEKDLQININVWNTVIKENRMNINKGNDDRRAQRKIKHLRPWRKNSK